MPRVTALKTVLGKGVARGWILIVIVTLLSLSLKLTMPNLINDLRSINSDLVPKTSHTPFLNSNITRREIREHLPAALLGACRKKWIDSGNCACPSYTKLKLISNDTMSASAVVAINTQRKQIIVSYRGSLAPYNWVTNFDYQLVPLPGYSTVHVHAGYLRHLDSLIPKLTKAVKKHLLNHPDYTLHITGYSLGGAIASVSVPSWIHFMKQNQFHHPIRFFSYATPRVGDAGFAALAASYNIPIVRLSIQNDIVHHFPPYSVGYVHIGQEYHEPEGNNIMIKCSTLFEEDPKCGFTITTRMSVLAHITPHYNYLPFNPFC